MRLVIKSGVAALAIAAASCGQGNSDNVMAAETNALDPAEINAALGPEVNDLADPNLTANEAKAVDDGSNASEGDLPAADNVSEQEARQ